MPSYDWCTKCHFRRWIEGYESEKDYLDNGWVKTELRVLDKDGIRSSISNWKCPVCDEDDKALIEKDRLMKLGSVRDPRSTDETLGPMGATREP